jgi:hypothetical protein
MVIYSKQNTYVFFAMYTKTNSEQEQKQQTTLYVSDEYGTGFLPYNSFSRLSNRFSRQQTAELSPFFQCGVNRVPRNVVRSTAVSIRCTKMV